MNLPSEFLQADWGTYNYTSSATVNLTENKKLTKPIVISNGATLTINNTTGKALTLSNGQGATDNQMHISDRKSFVIGYPEPRNQSDA